MRDGAKIAVIIPALNEELSIGKVVSAIPTWVDDIIVVDNGSQDATAKVAAQSGAKVVLEPRRGYGSACLRGIAELQGADVVVFLDGDFSDYPEEMHMLVDPLLADDADLVIGSRVLGKREQGALTLQARTGNRLACLLVQWFWGVKYTDLGPFRAISYDAVVILGMCDPNFGWTVEMQIKAVRAGLRIKEVPVSYRSRIGRSKVSGTVKGVVLAGTKILSTIFFAAGKSYLAQAKQKPWQKLILFTRYPEPGKTKTRLIPTLGAKKAADLQYQMTELILRKIKGLEETNRIAVEIRHEGGAELLMAELFGKNRHYQAQGNGDLGIRMMTAFAESFREGMSRVVIIGTDCPDLEMSSIKRAFAELLKHDVVFGPAEDGGYYLVGLKRLVPELFINIPWGTDQVLKASKKIAEELGLSATMLETLPDVDRPEDVHVWHKAIERYYGCSPVLFERDFEIRRGRPLFQPEQGAQPLKTPVTCNAKEAAAGVPARISVIIPTFNEAAYIGATLLRVGGIENVEVIVADGGSADRTRALAERLGARVVAAVRGRAKQMNAGAKEATGDILVFLHADTLLPPGWTGCVREVVNWPGTVCAAFEFRLDKIFPWSRIIERLANLRSRSLQMPYGDQAIFMKAELFHQVGGFPDMPIMEDFELIRKLRRQGAVRVVPLPAVTSARRWQNFGPLRTTLVNHAVTLGYMLGFSRDFLVRIRSLSNPCERR